MDNKPTQVYEVTFNHIHNTNGFAVSKNLTEDNKEYKPVTTHACLDYGYFCLDHLREKPLKIFNYLRKKLKRSRLQSGKHTGDNI